MVRSIFMDIWHGLWTGFGVELSVLLLWVIWKITHGHLVSRLHPEHWFHKIGNILIEKGRE